MSEQAQNLNENEELVEEVQQETTATEDPLKEAIARVQELEEQLKAQVEETSKKEQDLLLRGSGQLFGLAQSGLPDLRVANIIKDIEILVEARKDVLDFANQFGIEKLESIMKEELEKRFGEKFLRILYN